MPRRDDIHKILILGSGPIVIGQAAEFDYSGTQACKALRGAGFEVVLVNSNPATIMTDPDVADRTYVEPLTPEFVEKVIAIERPDALLPTLGGQTALNLASKLYEDGVLERHGVELIGANYDAIQKGEDRKRFQEAMAKIGIKTPAGRMVSSLDEALEFVKEIGYPAIIRPSFTLGGTGGGIAHDEAEFRAIVRQGLHDSPVHTVLVEQSVLGWKEYELEVMRDHNDTVVIICSIENFDPMGVHTGDSITVAPAQTLSDKEYQRLRDYSIDIIREIGVDTGGSNIQFAVNPEDGDVIVIEMNPRVSRSSALASKATGYPIAKIAALLAVGYHLDELPNDITKETKAAFEPTIDYVVTKIPRFAFEKFPGTPDELGTQMRSVGEVMAIGRTFKESLMKALRSLELDVRSATADATTEELDLRLYPNPRRLPAVLELLRRGRSVQALHERTGIDPWFLSQLREVAAAEREIVQLGEPETWSWETWREIKRLGFADQDVARLRGRSAAAMRDLRRAHHGAPVYKTVDTCAAEFEAYTPYFYSTYEWEDEAAPSTREKVIILGSGPNRIGQGVEFDYATVHAVWALHDAGYETIMINSNPETVSTDYDTADRLYFEPLTFEDVVNVVDHEKPDGVIVQLGGQTPLKLARALTDAGVPIWGTPAAAIHAAEDRDAFHELCERLGIPQPEGGVAAKPDEALALARRIGYPVMVRPSYVLGGLRRAGGRPHHPGGRLRRGCGGGRRRRHQRRQHDGGGGHHGARRAGGHPLGRQRLHRAARDHLAGGPGAHPRVHREVGRGDRRTRPHQRAVLGARRRGDRGGSQPARQPHHPVLVEGDRASVGQVRGPGGRRQDPGRTRVHRGAHPQGLQRQGGRASVPQVPLRAARARSGDALHRGEHGHRRGPVPGLLQGRGCCRRRPPVGARGRHGAPDRRALARTRAAATRTRLHDDVGHGGIERRRRGPAVRPRAHPGAPARAGERRAVLHHLRSGPLDRGSDRGTFGRRPDGSRPTGADRVDRRSRYGRRRCEFTFGLAFALGS